MAASPSRLHRAALARSHCWTAGPSSYRGCNDREAASIEQCVFFDRLISLAYEYPNGDAGRLDMAMDVTLRQLRAYVAVLESASFSEAARAMRPSLADVPVPCWSLAGARAATSPRSPANSHAIAAVRRSPASS